MKFLTRSPSAESAASIPLPGWIGDLDEDLPETGAEHFYLCSACGQAVDSRQTGLVRHHKQPGHRPLYRPTPEAWAEPATRH